MNSAEPNTTAQPARDRIIETTCELLELQGYHGTGLNRILSESNSPKGSLYHYFPGGKEELAVEALTTVGEVVLQRIRSSLAEEGPVGDIIPDFICSIAMHVERSGFRAGGPITTVALETASSSDRIREACTRIYGGWQEAFAERIMRSGIESSRARRLAALIVSAIEGGIILSRCERSQRPLEDVAAELKLMLDAAV